MSLLLDALRRAAASKQGPQADQYTIPRRADAELEQPRGRAHADPGPDDELTLEPEIREPKRETADGDAGAREPAEEAETRAYTPNPPSAAARRAAAGTLAGTYRGRARGRPLARLLFGAVAVVAALGAVAGGSWWYYLESRRASEADLAGYQPTAEPLVENDPLAVAGGGQAPATDADAADPEPDPQSGATATAQTPAGGASTAAEPAPEPAPDAGTGTAADAAPAAATGSGSGAEPETTAARTEPEPPAADPEPADGTASGGQAASGGTQSTSTQAARRAEPVVRATGPSRLAQELQAGYAALRAGDLDAAGHAYGHALELAPNHRDALLGAASVAQRRGDPARAAELYRRVLGDHPRDPHARAALAGLQGANEPRRSETELKRLLREQPESAALHFALGNLYAAESRWAEAQSSYFEAYRAAPEQADHAYNLAVALDHLGKRNAARDYYRRALAAVGGEGAQFPVAAARRRLEQLQ